MHQIGHDLLQFGRDTFAAIAPAAFGAGVAQAVKPGLNRREQARQWLVGIIVSHFVTKGLTAWLQLPLEVSQSVAFVVGMVAFQATPRFTAAAANAIARIPDILIRKKEGE